jgi:hypothetical protein
MDTFLEAADNCRQAGVAGRLRAVLKAQLQRWVAAVVLLISNNVLRICSLLFILVVHGLLLEQCN